MSSVSAIISRSADAGETVRIGDIKRRSGLSFVPENLRSVLYGSAMTYDIRALTGSAYCYDYRELPYVATAEQVRGYCRAVKDQFRPLVEATIGRFKRVIGDGLRSRTD